MSEEHVQLVICTRTGRRFVDHAAEAKGRFCQGTNIKNGLEKLVCACVRDYLSLKLCKMHQILFLRTIKQQPNDAPVGKNFHSRHWLLFYKTNKTTNHITLLTIFFTQSIFYFLTFHNIKPKKIFLSSKSEITSILHYFLLMP